MIQIDDNLITRLANKFFEIQDQIASEDFHSGRGCSCELCSKRNGVYSTLLDARGWGKRILNEKEEIEDTIKYYLK